MLSLNKQMLSLNKQMLSLNKQMLSLNKQMLSLNKQMLSLNKQMLSLNKQMLSLNKQMLSLNLTFDGMWKLTFPVKSVLQAANLHRGRVILTNLATVPGYQLVFCFDVLGS
ncbi:hypothetical protein, partial [Nostoc mirabile]|uniref:hypothetical protein n=1 Tax=Nostoc mirabile TaxID=2907820 RepID=UPI001E5F559E